MASTKSAYPQTPPTSSGGQARAPSRQSGFSPQLRHAFVSTAEDLGFTVPTIKALIGHAGSGVTEGYIHKADSALIAAANQIANHINGALNGTDTGAVIEFKSA